MCANKSLLDNGSPDYLQVAIQRLDVYGMLTVKHFVENDTF